MAIIWQKRQNGTRYEIRKAGNSTRLYTDGVFHSQYNPDHPITRSVWDLLMLPAFFYDSGSIKRVLVLGVGGGSVLQLLHKFVHPTDMVGIELNPVHIQIAKRFFGINKKISTLHSADAIRWMENYQGPPFDMIIDDLFAEVNGEGIRPVALNARWLSLLNRHLTKQGLIVANTIDTKTLKQCAYFNNQSINRSFKSAFRMSIPQLENVIAVFLKQPSSSKQLRRNIASVDGLNQQSGPNKLNVRITDITTD